MATYSYLRVSTNDQDLEKDRADVLVFSHQNKLGEVLFWEEKISGTKDWKKRKISDLIDELKQGDNVIEPDITRIAKNGLEIAELMNAILRKGANIFFVKSGWKFENTTQGRAQVLMWAIFADMQREFISVKTKKTLAYKKSIGVKLGRPKGKGKSKLDEYEDEIKVLWEQGVSQKRIAKSYQVTEATVSRWIKKMKWKKD